MSGAPAGEASPLLDDSERARNHWNEIRESVLFRRSRPSRVKPRGSLKQDTRASVRVPHEFYSLAAALRDEDELRPVDALSPLVAGGVITDTDGYTTEPHPPSVVKSLPAFAPFRRLARHRSFYLWWLNEFRHWWKSSRLLVRIAGLFTLAFTLDFLDSMYRVEPFKKHRRANMKNTHRAYKIVKKLGRGGPMSFFLNKVHIFTRTLRIVVAAWRWIESAQCRRGEVGVEEAMVIKMCLW